MATGVTQQGTIDSTGQTLLGAPDVGRVSSWLIHFESSSFSGSVTIKGAAIDSNLSIVAIAYKDMQAGTNATAAITGTALALVDSAGLDVTLDCTSYSSGSLSFYAYPLIG